MTELVAGLAIGLAAGITPGPLLALVVTSTLDRGFGAGARVAVAPLVSDTPVVVLSLAVLNAVPAAVLRGLGIAGGVYVILLGLRTLATRRGGELVESGGSADLWRGVVVNLLSPHPWLFWLGAGGPLVVDAWRRAPGRAVAFLVGFYLLLVGSKVAIAWAVGRGRRRLDAAWRSRLVVAGGVLLVAGGALLILEQLR